MSKFKVYKLTSPSGKSYIGQTKTTIEERFKQHVLAWRQHVSTNPGKRYRSKLYSAFSKYSPEQWKMELLYEVETLEEVDLLEIECIKQYNTINEGYNILNGGQGFQKDTLTEEHKNNLSISRKEYFKTEKGLEWKKVLAKRFSDGNSPSITRGDEIREKNSKWYLLIDVNDNEFIIKNLYEFKKTNKGKVVKMLPSDGNAYYCKYSDYRCMLLIGYSEELSDDEKFNIINESKLHLKPFKTWKLLSPDGIEYITCQLKVFAEEHNLTPQILSSVAKGKHPTHKGWGCTQII